MMKDHTHFITKDNIIFTTRGDIHTNSNIRATAIYFPSDYGNKQFRGIKYEKKIDEFGADWLPRVKPEYCIKDELGRRILVPERDITNVFDPFSVFHLVKEKTKNTHWESLVNELEKILPKEDIGFIGSYLIGFPSADSDLDIIIRGKDNLARVRREIDNLRVRLGAVQTLDTWRQEASLKKYHSIFNEPFNDFSEMIKRRWTTIRTAKFMTKLRFAYRTGEVPETTFQFFEGENTIVGIVLDDEGVNFMPRMFSLRSKEGKNYKVFTYFWDYSFCVVTGDKVVIKASLFDKNKLLLKDPKEHGTRFVYEN